MAITIMKTANVFNWNDLVVLRELLPPHDGESIYDYFNRARRDNLISFKELEDILALNEKNQHKPYKTK